MKNVAYVPNRKRGNLFAAAICLFVCAAVLLGNGIVYFWAERNNFSGNFSTVTGTVERVEQGGSDGVHELFLAGGEDYFLTTEVDELCDWQSLVGKEVKFFLPARQRLVAHPLILGVSVGETVLVSPNETVERARGDFVSPVFFLFAVIFLIAAIVTLLFRSRVEPRKEKSLTEIIARNTALFFSSQRFGREAWAVIPTLLVGAVLFFVCGIALTVAVLSDAPEKVQNILAIVYLVCFSLPTVAAWVLSLIAKGKMRNYYKRNFPPDGRDFSHVPAKKKVREEATRERTTFSEQVPDTYPDEANDYFVRFSKEGAAFIGEESLIRAWSEIYWDDTPFSEENFLFSEKNALSPDFVLPYEELHLFARRFRKSGVPVVLIVSRLSPETEAQLKEYGVTNDLHFVLDRCLLQTLRACSVEVEDPDGVLSD